RSADDVGSRQRNCAFLVAYHPNRDGEARAVSQPVVRGKLAVDARARVRPLEPCRDRAIHAIEAMSQLGDRLRQHAREDAQAPAIHANGRWWTFAELVAAADKLALGAKRGDVVAIAIDRGIEAVIATCAAALGDAVPAIFDPRDRGLAEQILTQLAPTC